MWSKSHGGDGQESGSSVIQTSDGGYLGVGFTNSWGNGGFDIFMVKLDANGNLEYEEVKGGFDWDFAWDVIEPSPGKFVIAAETQSFGNGNTDGWLLQFDEASRTWDWETTIGTPETENLKAVAKGNNNDFFAVGLGHANDPTDDDIMLVKFNSSGNSVWTKFYGDTLLDYGNDIIKMTDGHYGITGVREIEGYNPGVAVLKVGDDGVIDFDTNWSANDFQFGEGFRIMEIPTSRICIAGTVNKYSGNNDMYLSYSYPTLKLHEKGNTHGKNANDWGTSGLYLNNQGFLLAGHTNAYDNSFLNILTVKTDTAVQIDDPNGFYFNEDSINITGIIQQRGVTQNIQYNTVTNVITIDDVTNCNYILIDLVGRVIKKGRFNSSLSLNPLGLAPGLYIIHVFNENNHWSTQVLQN